MKKRGGPAHLVNGLELVLELLVATAAVAVEVAAVWARPPGVGRHRLRLPTKRRNDLQVWWCTINATPFLVHKVALRKAYGHVCTPGTCGLPPQFVLVRPIRGGRLCLGEIVHMHWHRPGVI